MQNYVTGATIKALREKKEFTQKKLAEILNVSDKTISKWETDRGLPDISLIEDLAGALGVSLTELLSGTPVENKNRSANMKKLSFYVCPICGNVITSIGQGSFSCCGVNLPVQEAEEPYDKHAANISKIDSEYYIEMNHPMTKTHYISFIACVTTDRVQLLKLYPEQTCSAYFPIKGGSTFYAYCNRHGLFKLN